MLLFFECLAEKAEVSVISCLAQFSGYDSLTRFFNG